MRRLANDICPRFQNYSQFSTLYRKSGKEKGFTDLRDYSTYSVMFHELCPAYSSSLKLFGVTEKKMLEVAGQLSFRSFSRWKMGCMERENVEYIWHHSNNFLQTFICSTQITEMILTALDQGQSQSNIP